MLCAAAGLPVIPSSPATLPAAKQPRGPPGSLTCFPSSAGSPARAARIASCCPTRGLAHDDRMIRQRPSCGGSGPLCVMGQVRRVAWRRDHGRTADPLHWRQRHAQLRSSPAGADRAGQQAVCWYGGQEEGTFCLVRLEPGLFRGFGCSGLGDRPSFEAAGVLAVSGSGALLLYTVISWC